LLSFKIDLIKGAAAMVILIIVLRVIHIFSAVFWVGFGLININFLQPTVKALGPDGQKFMQHLTQKTKLLNSVYTAATLTILSGSVLYYIVTGFSFDFIASGYGIVLSIASISGIIGWFIAVFIVRSIFGEMKVVGGQIQASGNPPTPEQAGQMHALAGRLGVVGKVAITFMLIALLGMSIARYVSF